LAALWAAHDRIARDLLPVRRGREIDKTDGMLLLFASGRRRGRIRDGRTNAPCRAESAAEGACRVHVGP